MSIAPCCVAALHNVSIFVSVLVRNTKEKKKKKKTKEKAHFLL